MKYLRFEIRDADGIRRGKGRVGYDDDRTEEHARLLVAQTAEGMRGEGLRVVIVEAFARKRAVDET